MLEGDLVADRYRLLSELGRDEFREIWTARDERLERRVALLVFTDRIPADQLRERAGRAATLTHPNITRVFDTGMEGGRVFCVRELVPGALAWTEAPLEDTDAVRVGAQTADALQHAHDRGIAHGGLGPGSVLLAESGAKIADFGLTDTALSRSSTSPGDDLEELAGLLERLGPSTWSVTEKLRAGQYDRASDVARDLRALRPAAAARRSRRSPILAVIAGVALTALVVFGVFQLGPRIGGPSGPTPAPAITGTPFTIRSVADFDPLGDGREGRRSVARIADGDPRTFWSTERYRGGPDFSGLKEGVGVILELGEAELAGRAQILFPAPGCTVELRHSTVRAPDVSEWEVLATVAGVPERAVLSFPPTSSRWWLVWVTRLTTGVPGARNSDACAISEAELYPP